jgi:hypothetical protein
MPPEKRFVDADTGAFPAHLGNAIDHAAMRASRAVRPQPGFNPGVSSGFAMESFGVNASIGFPVRRAVTSVVSCLEAYDGARDAAPRDDSAAARAGQHVMAAAIVPAHQIGLDGPLTEHHVHRILNVSRRDIAMRVDLP